MKKLFKNPAKTLIFVFSGALLLSSCGTQNVSKSDDFSSVSTSSENEQISSISEVSSESISSSNTASSSKISSSTISSSSMEITGSDFVQKITKAGTYTLTGEITGSILVDADDEDIEIVLNNANIASNFNSPIYVSSAGEVKFKLQGDNYINDIRAPIDEDNEDAKQGKGAIYAKCDLKFTSSGNLTINANYNNGIHSSDDIKFKNTSSIYVKSLNHAVKGNDSVEIESGKIKLISENGSGIKTENTSISSKGKQKGNIVISGGELEVYSYEDGIEAAHDVEITNNPKISIFTYSFSEYSNLNIDDVSAEKMYLRTGTDSYNYSVYFVDKNNNKTWVDATYSTSSKNSRGQTFYYYELKKPANSVSIQIFSYSTSTKTRTENNAIASSKTININDSYDTAILSVSDTGITCPQWTNFSSGDPGRGPGGPKDPGKEGNDDRAEVSAKGIKSDNEIFISGGDITVKAYDDAIHGSRGESLDNGETGQGNITISGGNFSLYATDDGIHADYNLNISGGNINIEHAFEGLEANIINISNGFARIYSVDDGINASKKAGVAPQVNISGGTLDITVKGNDVDGIDSNNSYTQTGGFVITKGANGGMSTGLDTDGVARVDGGSLIIFGRPEKTPTLGSGVSSYTLSGNYSIGTYLLSNTINSIEVTTVYSYTSIYVFSNESQRYTITKK